MPTFRDLHISAAKQVTLFDSPLYPDFLETANSIYAPIFEKFSTLLLSSTTSSKLLENITLITTSERIQLLRLFRRYVSPNTSVEMLKVKGKVPHIIKEFSYQFRDIETVRQNFSSRPMPDEVLSALLFEQASRGEKGYLLTQAFFSWFRENFSDKFIIEGPERAGKDINLSNYLENFDVSMPTDFIILDRTKTPLAVGFARYDTDRGGSQEDDRIKGNRNNAIELVKYNSTAKKPVNIIFLNDGPGLLLGSMWADYSSLEEYDSKILVTTLKMLESRLTAEWLLK